MNTSIILLSLIVLVLAIIVIFLWQRNREHCQMISSIFTYLHSENGVTITEIVKNYQEYVEKNIDITGEE